MFRFFRNNLNKIFTPNYSKLIKISSKISSKSNKIALVIYIPWAIDAYIKGKYTEQNFNSHSMYGESIEMVKLLLELDYEVHYIDCFQSSLRVEWSLYDIVIDERNNIFNNHDRIKGKKIYYATGCSSSFHNNAEQARISAFNKKFNMSFAQQRKIDEIFSDRIADVITYFGNDFQKKTFVNPEKAYSLNISTAYLPENYSDIPIGIRRNNFIWIGSRGFIHKGLDIVIEAFLAHTDMNLHICTNMIAEPDFYEWFKSITNGSTNIFYHGFMNVSSQEFASLINTCIAIPYLSCSEGGAGAVLQAMQFGCFPIVNEATALRGNETGIFIPGVDRETLLKNLVNAIGGIKNMNREDLLKRSDYAASYARKNHSLEAYKNSFKNLIEKINE